jgi:biotin carboxylase
MIARSFGSPDSYQLASTRSELASIATPAGVLLPRTSRISTVEELRDWLGREGFPAVLKANHSWGGTGVIVIQNLQEAELAYRRMTGPQELARAIKRLVWNQEPELFLRRSRGLRPVLSIQTYIPGRPANCAAACWEGEVIASIEVEVLVTQSPTGNATVVRVIHNPEIVKAARSVARRLGISGFFGFDFVLEEASGRPYLIEINPRATQINHLALGAGRDLPAALRARISGEPVRATRAVTDCETIALFPQEWHRDPQSRFFLTAYHDVPYDEPELVRALLRRQNSCAIETPREAICGFIGVGGDHFDML